MFHCETCLEQTRSVHKYIKPQVEEKIKNKITVAGTRNKNVMT